MNFYKKRAGRPTLEEQVLIQAIERVVRQKGISHDNLPVCETEEDLLELLQFVNEQEDKTEDSTEQQEQQENHTEEVTASEEIVPEEEKEAKEVSLVKEPSDSMEQTDTVIETGHLTELLENAPPDFVASDYDPFSQPIIERSYTQETSQKQSEASGSQDDIELEEAKEKTPLDDLPPVTKKRAAEQTADALLKGYARLVPEPFKWLAKISEEKVERMAFEGELDLSLEVSEGLTFEEYMQQTNEQVDEIFEVQEETIDEIREPLIEVLMEQELELTPTQRLTFAVVSHLIQMLTVALKLQKQNRRILSYQQHLTYLSRSKTA